MLSTKIKNEGPMVLYQVRVRLRGGVRVGVGLGLLTLTLILVLYQGAIANALASFVGSYPWYSPSPSTLTHYAPPSWMALHHAPWRVRMVQSTLWLYSHASTSSTMPIVRYVAWRGVAWRGVAWRGALAS